MAYRFALQPSFGQDICFFVGICAGHPGTEHWLSAYLHLKFLYPPEKMDAWAAAHIESFTGNNKHAYAGIPVIVLHI
jgi:hypothetical protein